MSTVLAFDIGLQRTGVASGHALNGNANPAGQIRVHTGRHDWEHLDKLIQEWAPSTIVIGKPNTQNSALNKAINRFKSHIQKIHKLPIVEIDETLTSHAANQEMAGKISSVKHKTQLRDQIAACLILETHLRSLAKKRRN